MLIFSFFVLNKLFRYWRKKPEFNEIPNLRPDDTIVALVQRYRYDVSKKFSNRARLRTKILWHMRKELFIQFLWNIQKPFAVILPSILIKYLLDSISARNNTKYDSVATPKHMLFLSVVLLALTKIVGSISDTRSSILSSRLEMRMKSILQAEIFAKALRISDNNQKGESNSGNTVNIFTYDAQKGTLEDLFD